jgi:hypothetical protein
LYLRYVFYFYYYLIIENLQNKRTVRLYKQAADHFAQGAKYGAMAQEKSLVLHAATNFWNAALSLMTSSDTRWYQHNKNKNKNKFNEFFIIKVALKSCANGSPWSPKRSRRDVEPSNKTLQASSRMFDRPKDVGRGVEAHRPSYKAHSQNSP